MTVSVSEMRNQESVKRWMASRVQLWGATRRSLWGSVGDNEGLLETLSRFCEAVGKDPDAMIDDCLQPAKEGEGLMLRMRARREYVSRIEQFESSTGREAANVVRSFFIHNGVAMNPSILA